MPAKRMERIELCTQLTARFTQADAEKTLKLAEVWGCDISDVLRRALRELLANQGLLSDEEYTILTSRAQVHTMTKGLQR